jgi:hypothetical protein
MLLNCDQVFDVLTRGPFPTGEPEDDAVERHLRACHDCRQLAEALRPAVALLHEAIETDEASELPEYQGALPWKRPERRRRLSLARLAAAREGMAESGDLRRGTARSEDLRQVRLVPRAVDLALRSTPAIRAMRVVAASLLVFALGALLFAIAWAPNGKFTAVNPGAFSAPAVTRQVQPGVPTAKGLLTLAALKLPQACIPDSHRAFSAEDAAQIARALDNGTLAKLRCCTECHHAGTSHYADPAQPASTRLIAIAEQNCQVCHRG